MKDTKNLTMVSGDDLSGNKKIAIAAEFSALKEGINQNNELRDRLIESSDAVEDEAIKVIDAMGLAFDQKTESIEAMRSWRKTIVTESSQAINAINACAKAVAPEKLAELREFVDLVERLNKVDPNILVGKLFDGA